MASVIKTILRYLGAIAALLVLCVVLAFAACYVSPPLRESVHENLHGTAFESVFAFAFSHEEHPEADEHAEPSDIALDTEIMMSEQALKNCGITGDALLNLEVGHFAKNLTFPAMVIDRPGRSIINVPSPGSGVVSRIFVDPGVAVVSGDPLFEILLTRQELVETQSEFISLLQKRDIIDMEIERLAPISSDIAPKAKRDAMIQKQEIEASLENQRNLLRLQGLAEEDILERLEKERKIVRTMTVRVPAVYGSDDQSHTAEFQSVSSEEHEHKFEGSSAREPSHSHPLFTDSAPHPLEVIDLLVERGQQVSLGDTLCRIGDLCQLVIEGKAFATDEEFLTKTLVEKRPVSLSFSGRGGERELVENLRLRSLDNRINPEQRSLSCFVELPNHPIADELVQGGGDDSISRRFITWRFKPGQRCELNVQYDTIENCFVVPIDAVAKELNETSVFEFVGMDIDLKIWKKRPVHVIYQTKSHAVIANDGSIFPGAQIASRGASYLLAALNAKINAPKGGGGIVHGDHVH